MIPIVGECSDCGAPLAAGQRYCIKCGLRAAGGGLPFGLAPAMPGPVGIPSGAEGAGAGAPTAAPGAVASLSSRFPPQMMSLYAALALGFGMVIGTAIEPNLAGISAAGTTVIELPSQSAPPTASTPSGGGGGGGGAGGFGAGGGAGGGAPISTGPSFAPPPPAPAPSPAPPPTTPTHKPRPSKTFIAGTVVHVNPVAHSYAITRGGAQLSAIHSPRPADPGTTVRVPVRTLANTTYAELKGRRRTGEVDHARFAGNVTFTGTVPGDAPGDPPVRVYAVSSRGVSVLVRMPADQPGQPPLAVPSPGDSVVVEVDLVPTTQARRASAPDLRLRQGGAGAAAAEPAGPGQKAAAAAACSPPAGPLPSPPVEPAVELVQTRLTVNEGISLKHSDAEAVVQGCPDDHTLVISADDTREGAQDITLALDPPADFDLSRLQMGEAIDVTLERDTGAFTKITGLSSDQGMSGADDRSSAQGDQ